MILLATLLIIIAVILPTEIITLLTPLILFGCTALVKWLYPKMPGWLILSVVVPVLSVLAALIVTLIIPGLGFFIHVALGLLSVFVAELIRQFQQGNNKNTEPVKKMAKKKPTTNKK